MNDSDDPSVFIHVVDEWVQLALSDALREIAQNIRCETKSMKQVIDVFDDILRCNAPDMTRCDRATQNLPVGPMDNATTAKEFVADAVLARLGVNAITGQMLFGVDRWTEVRKGYLEIFANAIQSRGLAAPSAETREVQDEMEEPAPVVVQAPSAPWLNWIRRFGIRRNPNLRLGETKFSPEEVDVWTARAAPAHPAVTQLSSESKPPSTAPSVPEDLGQVGQPGFAESLRTFRVDKARTRRRSEKLPPQRRDSNGMLGGKT